MTPTQIVDTAWKTAGSSPTFHTLLREIVARNLIPEDADDVFEAAVIRECKESSNVRLN